MASVSLIFLWHTLLHAAQAIPQLIQFHSDRFLARYVRFPIAFLHDELLANLRRAQPGIQSATLKPGVGLALPIHDGFDIFQQIR